MCIANSLLWERAPVRVKTRNLLPQGVAKQGGHLRLTGIGGFLGNYRNGRPFLETKPGLFIDRSDAESTLRFAKASNEAKNPAAQGRGGVGGIRILGDKMFRQS